MTATLRRNASWEKTTAVCAFEGLKPYSRIKYNDSVLCTNPVVGDLGTSQLVGKADRRRRRRDMLRSGGDTTMQGWTARERSARTASVLQLRAHTVATRKNSGMTPTHTAQLASPLAWVSHRWGWGRSWSFSCTSALFLREVA